MNQNHSSNPAIFAADQDFFSNEDAFLQETTYSDSKNGDFIIAQSKKVKPNQTQSYEEQIEALVNQLKINEEHHAKVLKEHQSILANKDRLVEEKKRALERINESHSKRVEQLIQSQQQALSSCRMQHHIEVAKLERQLQQQENEAKGIAVEQLLNNFEQEQHTLRVDCSPVPRQCQLDIKNTTHITNKNTPFTKPLCIPTSTISWPPPPPLSSLRKSSAVYSQEN
ncbi:hypothetical protein BCR42DRAFT_405860 [Absidia repens]|uniref:Uncharacterized protein n=1 Tax=Absidia repens TaxID=90262 RepID=A0A1X2IU22_9FUNG|nr:hypothetical protein BCR42DRAFT_405860 [Absidia repens]